jgi:flagellar motor switch protein FliN/FliY
MHTALRGSATLADLGDVTIEAVVELGRAAMPLREARALRAGDVLSLGTLAGAPTTVRLNGQPFAEGEIVIVNDTKCCRLVRMAPVPGVEEERGR